MIEEFWADVQAMPAGDLFWCLFAGAVAFAAEFAVRYSLFPRIGIDRRWAYSFGVSSGLLAFGLACESVFGWLALISLFNLFPGYSIYQKRFMKSKVYMKVYIGSLSRDGGFYAIPVMGFVISCVELFSFSKFSDKIFYSGEISADHPMSAVIYACAIIGFFVTIFYLVYLF